MPIVASRSGEIRRLIAELADPKRRAGTVMRLRSMGSRVVPHAASELGRLDAEARRALLLALRDVHTADARALKKRLVRIEPSLLKDVHVHLDAELKATAAPVGVEAQSLDQLRSLPPPRANERAAFSRQRGEAHLALARIGSRLARKDLLQCLETLGADRTRLYCEAAGLIGDRDFLAPLSRLAGARPEAAAALRLIATREKISARSKALRELEEPLRLIVAKALVGA